MRRSAEEGNTDARVAVLAQPGNSAGVGGRVPVALRQARMMHAFDQNGFVSVIDMAARIGVSTMTIRRDFDLLESAGKITRIHGGAVAVRDDDPPRNDDEESIFDRRLLINGNAKAAIARAAARLVQPSQSVGLDTGTTVLITARALSGCQGLRYVTSNLRAATLLSESGARVYLLGGEVRAPELSVVGSSAIRSLQSHFLDLALIGVSAVDCDGFYDFSPEDTEVKLAMIGSAARVAVLCDASKFGGRALARIGTLDAIDVLITDRAPPPDLARALAAADVEVVIGDPGD